MSWSTVLTSDADAEQTILSVGAVPVNPRFPLRAIVDTEIVWIRGIGAGVVFVDRGALGSDPAPHAARTPLSRSYPTDSASQQGPQGPAGPTGSQGQAGPQGVPGPDGAQGETGPAGRAGDDGPTGAPGADGSAGAQGPAGNDGAPGAQGPAGNTGAASTVPGPQGIQGIPGNDGAQGPAGAQGNPGGQGIQGNPGNDGAAGSQGIQGNPGGQGIQGIPGPGAVYGALADGTLAMAFGAASVRKVTPTATGTFTTTVPAAGTACTLLILTSGVTSRTITFGSGFKPVGTLATGTVTARVFSLHFVSDGTNLYEAGRTAAMVA